MSKLLSLSSAAFLCGVATLFCPVVSVGQSSDGSALRIVVDSAHRTYTCNGGPAQISGSSNVLTINGRCSSMQVSGNSNSITVGSVDSVQFSGDSNSVIYLGGNRPTISNSGESNAVSGKGGAVASSHGAGEVNSAMGGSAAGSSSIHTSGGTAISITGDHQQMEDDCGNGKSVTITGSSNQIQLHGSCKVVSVTGSGNSLQIDRLGTISIAAGSDNSIAWKAALTGARPVVKRGTGSNNTITRQSN